MAAAPDVLNPREIRDLFSTPLLTGDDRRALRETFLTSRRNVQTLNASRDEESVRREFDRQVFDPATLAALRADGTVASARAWFAQRASAS